MPERKLGISLAFSVNLFRRRLVIMSGHIITKFLDVFGLNTIKDLPKIEELKKPAE